MNVHARSVPRPAPAPPARPPGRVPPRRGRRRPLGVEIERPAGFLYGEGVKESSKRAPRWMAVVVAAAGLAVAVASCGDDGKPKLYEQCNANQPCTEGLACFNGACSRACEYSSTSGPPEVGSCEPAKECVDDLSGCCLLNLIDGYTGTGNCVATVTPATP